MLRPLHSGFLRSMELFPDRPAIEVKGRSLSYRELFAKAASIAATLQRRIPMAEPPLTAVFGHRSVTAFAGVLGALLRGHGYVPLNPTFPAERTRTMLLRSGCKAVVVDAESAKQLDEMLPSTAESLLIEFRLQYTIFHAPTPRSDGKSGLFQLDPPEHHGRR